MNREAEREALIFALTGLYVRTFGRTTEAVSKAKEAMKEVRQKVEEWTKEKQEECSDSDSIQKGGENNVELQYKIDKERDTSKNQSAQRREL